MTVKELVKMVPGGEVRHVSYPCPSGDMAVLVLRQTVDLVEFGEQLGLEAVPHNRQGDLVWDVKQEANTSKGTLARSQTSKEFPVHTDASFELRPPRFFMLQVLHHDRFGGGLQQFTPLRGVLNQLLLERQNLLMDEKFKWQVPIEFRKDTNENELPILFDNGQGGLAVRYREECIKAGSSRQFSILNSFKAALQRAPYISHRPTQGEIVLVDNWRMLHSRSEVRDPLRHLQRVRFTE